MLIILMRHGRTEGNDPSNPTIRGWKDSPLTPEGRLDVQMTANKLKAYNPQWIDSSDFMRDTETAYLVANQLNIANVETHWLARTWDTGDFSGKPESEVGQAIKAIYERPWESAPGGSESYNTFLERWQGYLEGKMDLAANVDEMRPGIVVTHGRNIAATYCDLEQQPLWKGYMPFPSGFACVMADEAGDLSLKFVGKKEPLYKDV
jgi:broad specificity phosphatase PhoE